MYNFLRVDIDKEKKRANTLSTLSSNNRVNPLLESYVDPNDTGVVVDMAHFTAGGQNVLSYVTTKGRLCGLDLRSNDTIWSLTNNPKFGECIHTWGLMFSEEWIENHKVGFGAANKLAQAICVSD